MTPDIKSVLELHRGWIVGDASGCRANLSGANLSRANLSGANLSRANLSGADLSGANLYRANLSRANLSGADLSGANLYRANLYRANLSGANLYRANLSRANLSWANLYRANLSRANLSWANLYGADLSRANLSRANLSRANLSGANLSGAQSLPPLAAAVLLLPAAGTLVVWKKCRDDVLVKLRVPEEARRSNATGRKCRCEFADVLEVVGAEVGVSIHDGQTTYRVGQRVACDEWCADRWRECEGGIHFYLTREEAEAHT